MLYVYVFALVFLLSCEEKKHAVNSTLIRVADALKFHDRESLANMHIENSKASTFCNPEFSRIMAKVIEGKTEARCKEVKSITKIEFSSLPDNEKVLAQFVLHVCEQRSPSCVSFSKERIQDMFQNEKWIDTIKEYEIEKVMGDDGVALAYMILHTEKGVEHRTLRFKKIVNDWKLIEGILREQK